MNPFANLILLICICRGISIRPPIVCPITNQTIEGEDDFDSVYYCMKDGDLRVTQYGSPTGTCKRGWLRCETCTSKHDNLQEIDRAISHDLITYVDKQWWKKQQRIYKKHC